MPGPKLPEYPKPMFRPDRDPIYAKDAKEEDFLAKEENGGWSTTYVYREFPKMLYWPGEKKTRGVNSKAEEEAALAEGWVSDPEEIHYGEDAGPANIPLPGPESGSPAASNELLKAQQDQIAKQSQQIAELTELVSALVDAKPKKHKKSDSD